MSKYVSRGVTSGGPGVGFESSVNPISTGGGGQIMPTTLLLANPDLKT